MSGSCTPLHVFDAVTVNIDHYRDEILKAYMRLFRGGFGLDFMLMYDNACPHTPDR